MQAAAGALESASVRMAQSLKAAGMSSADAASAMKNLGFSAAETSTALQGVGLVAAQTATQVEGTTVSLTGMDRAMALSAGRIAGMAAGSGMLGGALGRVAAASSTLGPILAAAFPIVAAVALVDIASKLPNIFHEIIDAIAGWDEASKKSYSEIITSNTNLLLESTRLKIQVEALNEIGAKGTAKYGLAIKDNVDAQKAWGQTSAELLRMQQSLNREIDNLRIAPDTVPGAAPLAHFIAEAGDHMKQLRKELEEVNKALEIATRTEQELAQVGAPKAAAEAKAAGIDEQKKALENLARETDRQSKEEEEAAVKRGNAERQAAEEKERLDEEVATHSREVANKDLEDWRRSLVQKTSITEEEGRNALAQIRANAELAEKATAEHKGAASPEIKTEAFEAYREEIAIIQQLVAAEDELQEKLKATGAAQDDPKILESMRRQAAAMQQMNVAWDQYAAKVQQVIRAQQQQVSQMVNTIGADFSRGIVSWMNGQETFGRAMQKVWTQFADTVVSSLLKAGFQMVANIALQKSLTDSTKVSDAEAAARHTWTAVSAIPIIGPFLAPEAAAAAFAGVMAFESGGMVPGYGPTPAIVHGGEMILNQDQQRALGGGSQTFNFNHHGGGSAEQVRTSSREFFKMAKREMRRLNR
jgi:hypothetical protein